MWSHAIRRGWVLALVTVLSFAPSVIAVPPGDHATGGSSLELAPGHSNTESVIPTHAGLRLRLRADCGDVRIFTDSPDALRYAVEPDPSTAASPATILHGVSLVARTTARGVALSVQAPAGLECRGGLIYVIHVPRRYDIDIAVESGDLVLQDLDGAVALSTGGGEIRTGNIGASDARPEALRESRFIVRLETGGGNVSVGNIAAGLRAETAGGRISAGDVHGPAVLRTGGGDIRVRHVFGPARVMTGGGDIVAQKIDGGLWADTAGGRVRIGDASTFAAFAPRLSSNPLQAFAAALPPNPGDPEEPVAMDDLTPVRELARLFDDFVWGGIRVPPADQQKRLIDSIAPEYPDVARLAGIDGEVTLRILVGRDGTVRDISPLSGPPILVRAAIRAVEQWRYAPALIDGHPVDVVTTVTLAFRLRP